MSLIDSASSGLKNILGAGGQPSMVANEQFGLPTVLLSKIQNQNSKTIGLQIDAIINEKHKFKNQVTNNPLETGEPVMDNVINMPFMYEMKGRITTTPIDMFSALLATAAGAVVSSVNIPGSNILSTAASISAGVLSSKSSTKRHITAYDVLVKFCNEKTILQIITGIKIYQNMVFEDLEFPREKGDGRSLVFNASFKQLLLVDKVGGFNVSNVSKDIQNGIPTNL